MADGTDIVRVAAVGEPGGAYVAQVNRIAPAALAKGAPDLARDQERRLDAVEAWQRACNQAGDKFRALVLAGRVHPQEARAGGEIALVLAWMSGALRGLVQTGYDAWMPSDTSGNGVLWLDLLEAEHKRFGPWRHYAEAYPVNGSSLYALTLAFVVEGKGTQQVADSARMHRHRAMRLLRRSLWWYVHHAGWDARTAAPEMSA